MKKVKVLITIIIALMVSVFNIGNFTASSASSNTFSKLEFIEKYPENYEIRGVSPSGEKILTYDWDIKQLKVIDTSNKKVLVKYNVNNDIVALKRAQWSKDETSFVLVDSYSESAELTSYDIDAQNYYLFNIKTKTKTAITNESLKQIGNIMYAPSLSVDEKSLFYTFMNYSLNDSRVTSIYKVNILNRQKTLIYQEKGTAYIKAFELKDGLLLCNYENDIQSNRLQLFLLDEKTQIKRQITFDYSGTYLIHIRQISNDHRTVLINLYPFDSTKGIKRCLVLSFDKTFEKYTTKTIEYGMMRNKDNIIEGWNTALLPDGKGIISREEEGKEGDPVRCEIAMYNLTDNHRRILYSYDCHKDAEFGISFGLNGFSEAMSITNKNKVFIWFFKGYKVFMLK